MILRFCSGSVTPASRSRNSCDGVDEDERQLQPLEPPADLRRFVEPQHAVVDEDARQPIADRAVDEQRRDRRIDAAAQPADDAAARRPARGSAPSPPRRTTPSSSRRCSRRRRRRSCAGSRGRDRCARPRDGTAARRAARPASAIAATGALALVAMTAKPGGAAVDEVAMARPDAQLVGHRREAAARPASMRDRRVAELAVRRRRDLAAERVGHQLHAVADAEHRHAGVEHAGSQCGAPASDTLFGPPDRMTPTGAASAQFVERRVERQDLGIDRQLAQAARDQLGELRAEIEDDDGLMGHGESAIIRCASRGHHHIL